jgi:hypothetical protein
MHSPPTVLRSSLIAPILQKLLHLPQFEHSSVTLLRRDERAKTAYKAPSGHRALHQNLDKNKAASTIARKKIKINGEFSK